MFSLNTTIIKPDKNNKINSAVIMLHGYGGDGKDISALTYNWKRFLPNTVFLCPDAHEKCSINPSGFQWFDLNKDDSKYIIDQSLKAEKVIHQFIKEVKELYKLNNSKICFSIFLRPLIILFLTFEEMIFCLCSISTCTNEAWISSLKSLLSTFIELPIS